MEQFTIRGGRCTVGDDAIRVEEGLKTFVEQKYEDRPVLVGGLLVGWGLALVGMIVFSVLMFASEENWKLFFDLMMASAGISGLGAFSTFLLAMWWTLSIKRAQRAGDFPRNLSDEDVIPTEWVESVRFGTHRNLPVAFVELRRDGERSVRPIMFREGDATEAENVRDAFRSLDVAISGYDSIRTATF